jgi:hypothetical protein
MSKNNKCDCCGIEQIKVNEYEMLINGKKVGTVPVYNVEISTFINGRRICEECMDKYEYINAIFTVQNVSRAGIKYFADGREREKL